MRKGLISNTDYKQYRNKLTHLLRLRKQQYYIEMCNKNIHNPKAIWEHLNHLVGRTQATNFLSFDPNKMNDFFVNLGPSTVANLPESKSNYKQFILPLPQSFYNVPATIEELRNIVNALPSKKSAGFDGLSVKNLKNIIDYIAEPLLQIINKSFSLGIFPDVLKIARVVPIFKEGSTSELINYRPISILPSLSKIFERLMYNRMLSYINKFNILSNDQFGFRKNRNTELAVIHALMPVISSLNEGLPSISLFIDIAKAFDSINHQILLDKLFCMGFRGVALKWLNSYLNMRFQYVESNGVQSSMRKITCGVPQGSVLGPLLFLLYINDLTSLSKTNKCLRFALFADDTTVIFSDPSLKQSTVIAEACFSYIFEWFLANKLLINISKTYYICFGHNFVQHDNIITVCNHRINRVNHTKFLGIYIDEKLTWY